MPGQYNRSICECFSQEVFEPGREIYVAGVLSSGMHVTDHGSFSMKAQSNSMEDTFKDTRYFAEVSLYAKK